MELGADEPFLIGQFHHFNQIALRVASHTLHAVLLKIVEVLIVELIAMTVTLLNVCLTINGTGFATFSQSTIVGSQSHRSSHTRDVLLLFHQVDDRMLSLWIHLCAVGISKSQHIAGELNHHHLHTQTNAESGDVVGAGILNGGDLSFDVRIPDR